MICWDYVKDENTLMIVGYRQISVSIDATVKSVFERG